MVNKNVLDMVLTAIEEYNNYAKSHDLSKHSQDELRGLFYTTLRRFVQFGSYPRPTIRIDDFSCTFSGKGLITNYSMRPQFISSVAWDDFDSPAILKNEIREIGILLPTLYPTKILNEMAIIVNSIKQ